MIYHAILNLLFLKRIVLIVQKTYVQYASTSNAHPNSKVMQMDKETLQCEYLERVQQNSLHKTFEFVM